MRYKPILGLVCLFGILTAPAIGTSGESPAKLAKKDAAMGRVPSSKTAISEEERARRYFTDLPLVTQEGKRVRFYTDVLKDKVVLINFIYTNCRDACPLLVHKLTQVKEQLGDLFGKELYFVSISTDPARDDPAAMAKFAKQQKAEHPGWIFLTGEKKNLDAVTKKLGQYSLRPESHSTAFIVGNVRTRHWVKIRPDAPAEGIALKIRDLASESSATGRSGVAAGSRREKD